MAVQAARIGLVKVCATDGSFVTLGGVQQISPSGNWHKAKAMDTTVMGDVAGRSISSGFYDGTLSVSGVYDPADAGWVILLANLASCYVEYLPNGTTGFKAVMSADLKLSPAAGSDPMKFSVDFAICNGAAPTAVT